MFVWIGESYIIQQLPLTFEELPKKDAINQHVKWLIGVNESYDTAHTHMI